MAGENQVQAPVNILSAFLPQKPGTRSETVTEKTDLSPEAIDEIIRNMMESDSGLAAILQGQAGKGLYNSTTAQLMANDLASRVAGKAALASAPKTTSSNVKSTMRGESQGADPKYAAGLKLLEALTSSFFGKDAKGGAGGGTKGDGGFQNILDTVLGRKSKGGNSDDMMGGGFNPVDFMGGGNDFFSGAPLGTMGGGSGNFGSFSPMANNFFGGSGFGSGGFDSLSFGLGGGGYGNDPFSMTGGGNFNLGNSFGGGSNFANSFSSGVLSGWGGGSSFDSFSSPSASSNNWGPVDYGFGGGFSNSWF